MRTPSILVLSVLYNIEWCKLGANKHYDHCGRKLRDNGEWLVATHARDSKLGSRRYREVNVAATSELKRLVNSLIKADDKPKVKGSCHNCEKEEHWVRDCFEPKKDYKPRSGNTAKNKGR